MAGSSNETPWDTVRRLLFGLLALLFLYKIAEDAHGWLTKKQCERFGCWSEAKKSGTVEALPGGVVVAKKARYCASHAPSMFDWLGGLPGYVVLPVAFGLFVFLPAALIAKAVGIVRLGTGR
jgi:hypothetical protein